MPAGGMNTQTDTLVGYGMDKANPGGLIEDNDTIGQSVPKPGSFTTLTSTGGYTPAGDITLANGKAIKTDTTTAHTAVMQAYDVDGAAYKTFLTLTNGNTPSMAIAAPSGGTVTMDGAVIGGTTPLAGSFTTASATGILTTGSGKVSAIRVVTAAGAITVATTDDVVVVNKASGAATVVNLPATPTTGTQFIIKDGKGDAASNNITVTPAAGNIDGSATYVLNTNYGSVKLVYNGTQWNII